MELRLKMSIIKRSLQAILIALVLGRPLFASTIFVPQDCPTIKEALRLARDGDTVEVDDGFYFEKNIIVDKKIQLKSRNLYGAIIDGSHDPWSSIFIIRGEAEVEGFVLKNAYRGIMQRDSPDVNWSAHDLVILDMKHAAVIIDDREHNIGFAALSNIIVDRCSSAFATNDARGLEVRNCFIIDSVWAFSGYNHFNFDADRITLWNFKNLADSSPSPAIYPATNEIQIGNDIVFLEAKETPAEREDFYSFLPEAFPSRSSKDQKRLFDFQLFQTRAFSIIGNVYFRMEDYDQAEKWTANALKAAEITGSPEIVWNSSYLLGKINEKKGEIQQALKFYKEALEIIETVRNSLHLSDQKIGFMRTKLEVYESLINLLYELNNSRPSPDYTLEAFNLLEKSKARAFLDTLQESNLNGRIDPESPSLRERKSLLKEMARIQILLKAAEIPPKQRQMLLLSLENLESRYQNLFPPVRANHQEFSQPAHVQPLGLKEVQGRLLDKQTALLEYMIGREHSFAFLVTAEGLYLKKLLDPELISLYAINYRHFLSYGGERNFLGERGGKKLYDLLIRPFSSHLLEGIKRIIIIPDGPLSYLPFEALIREDSAGRKSTGGDSRFLVEDYEISYSSSASSLIHISGRKPASRRDMDLFSAAFPGKNFSESLRSFFDPDVTIKWQVFALPVLKNAFREIKTISRFFDREKTFFLLGDEATEKRMKELDLSGFKVLHFAAHAEVDDENWWRSSLLLSPDKAGEEDGFLQPLEIIPFTLNSELVVLSACRTGSGKQERGEGILGFVRSFLYAGSKSVLASLWKVEDKAASRFMECFYRRLARGATASQALRLAKIEMIRSKFRHPRHWSAFVLNGDYRSSLKN